MVIDWQATLLGFSVGVPVSLIFFAGLAWGVRLALRSSRPGVLLLLSFVCRVALLLATGFWLLSTGETAWPLAGYALAFFLLRIVAVFWARTTRPLTNAKQERA
ncbi:MAG TPA: ATP synthase subunit I [Woeseiaceae bacterium]|nr:ATP synthase subunit I [Woeseiaceae bacterium]